MRLWGGGIETQAITAHIFNPWLAATKAETMVGGPLRRKAAQVAEVRERKQEPWREIYPFWSHSSEPPYLLSYSPSMRTAPHDPVSIQKACSEDIMFWGVVFT